MIVVAWVVSRPSTAHTALKMPQAARVPPDAEDRWTMTVLPSTPHFLSLSPMVKPVTPSSFWPPATMPGRVITGAAVPRSFETQLLKYGAPRHSAGAAGASARAARSLQQKG